MPARRNVEERMLDFRKQCESLTGPELLEAIHAALADSSNLVVEMAATAVVDLSPGDCRDQLVDAYTRFLPEPLKDDKNCRAKLPIVEALNHQGFDDPNFYLAGMRYVQMEPAYGAPGGYADTAGNLRGTCALGLIRIPLASQNEMLFALVDLLNDNEAVAREAAARALGATGLTAAAAILRMKVLQGDRQLEVIGACFSGLLGYSDQRCLEFVTGYLSDPNRDLAIEASLALGESRRPEAIEPLIRWSETSDRDQRQSALLSLGLSRLPQATDFLMNLIEGQDPDAETALRALAPSQYDAELRARVERAVSQTRSRALADVLAEVFDAGGLE